MSKAKETIELLDFLFDLGDAVQASLADDGKVTLSDAPKFFGTIWKAPAAIGGIQNVPKEIGELDATSREQVMAFVRKRFELPDEDLETLIEDTLETGLTLAGNVSRWAKYSKRSKAEAA